MRAEFNIPLKKCDLDFMEEHRFTEGDLFAHPTLPVKKWPKIMHALEMPIAWGEYCKKGHRLRGRYNRCVVCSPKILSFQERFQKPAYIYVARSAELDMVKIGITNDYNSRIDKINYFQLGSVEDWEMVFYKWCDEAGRIEAMVHKRLRCSRLGLKYARRDEVSRETFRCSAEDAVQIVERMIDARQVENEKQEGRLINDCEIDVYRNEVRCFKELLRFMHNPYRNNFNLLYELYGKLTGSMPRVEGDVDYPLTRDQVFSIMKESQLPADFIKAWPRSPKRPDGVIEAWMGRDLAVLFNI